MTSYSCLFEAKSIQKYILRSGRLRHIVGASELIDSITGELLDDVLEALRITEGRQVRFSRRAGGSVYLFSSECEVRNAFRDLWTLVVRQYAPGLEFILACGEGNTDYAAFHPAAAKLQAARNHQPPALPSGGPVTMYAPRTGNPAVANEHQIGYQDAATVRFGMKRFLGGDNLVSKFNREVPAADWPRSLEYSSDSEVRSFPFLRENRYLALLHADGNSLGQLLMNLSDYVKGHSECFVDLFQDFSVAIEQATQAAAQKATELVLLPARIERFDDHGSIDNSIPARPIVLGGDDLTILLRSDLAFPFAQSFLHAFEHYSRIELAKLKAKYPDVRGLPDTLTAGAGIAFVKSNHPFHLAHGLAESLAKHAKSSAKALAKATGGAQCRIPPSVSFHRVTSSTHGDYDTVLKDEMTYGHTGEQVMTTLGVYTLDPERGELPSLDNLMSLVRLLDSEAMARGPARQLLTLLGQDQTDARRRYERWREVLSKRTDGVLQKLDAALENLCGELASDLPVSRAGDPRRTPLGDAAILLSVNKGAAAVSSTSMEYVV